MHFAVDPSSVMMTTRLAGARTRFLPFNRARDLGAGNPPNPDGHRHRLPVGAGVEPRRLDGHPGPLRARGEARRRGRGPGPDVIFPRFHQWDAVRRLEADAKQRGPGFSYLVQHSAGSGKSNSIAWLAHRLSSLHSDDDAKVFHKGGGHHRPGRARPPAARHHQPVRARNRGGATHRRGLGAAGRGPGRASRPASSSPRCRSSRSSSTRSSRCPNATTQ